MQPDDELCLCFHVTQRKVVNYIRIEKPRRAGELAECYGAGTGCGWCRPYLRRLYDQITGCGENPQLPTQDEYTLQRSAYIQQGKGTPPGPTTQDPRTH